MDIEKDRDFSVGGLNLKLLREHIEKHEPYAILTVSTTGLDKEKDGITFHDPTRVVVHEYTWNEEIKQYQRDITFDRLVKCNEEALKAAIEDRDNYDAFAEGGIDLDDYINGKNVLSKEEFQKEFVKYSGLLLEDTLLIANDVSHSKHFLDKVGCADIISQKEQDYLLLDQTHLTKEYIKEHGINTKKFSLGTLSTAVRAVETQSPSDKAEGKPIVLPEKIDAKIIGGDGRADVIHAFITSYGREKGIFEDKRTAYFREGDAQIRQSYVDAGKEKYQNEGLEGKIRTMTEMNKDGKAVIDTEAVLDRDSDCDINKFFDIFEKKNGNKGFTIIQTATTGKDKAFDEPIQVTVISYEVKNGEVSKKKDGLHFEMMPSEKAFQKAERELQKWEKYELAKAEAEAKGEKPPYVKPEDRGFDAYSYTGIDRELFINGVATNEKEKVLSKEEAVNVLNSYFSKLNTHDYPVITNGSLTEPSLKNIGISNLFDEKSVDFVKVVQQYCHLAIKENYDKNVLIKNPAEYSEPTLGIQDIAKANDEKDDKGEPLNLASTLNKCKYILKLADRIAIQHKELSNFLEQSGQEIDYDVPQEFYDDFNRDIDEATLSEITGDFGEVEEKEPVDVAEVPAPEAPNADTAAMLQIISQQAKLLEQANELLIQQNRELTEQNKELVQHIAQSEMKLVALYETQQAILKHVMGMENKSAFRVASEKKIAGDRG